MAFQNTCGLNEHQCGSNDKYKNGVNDGEILILRTIASYLCLADTNAIGSLHSFLDTPNSKGCRHYSKCCCHATAVTCGISYNDQGNTQLLAKDLSSKSREDITPGLVPIDDLPSIYPSNSNDDEVSYVTKSNDEKEVEELDEVGEFANRIRHVKNIQGKISSALFCSTRSIRSYCLSVDSVVAKRSYRKSSSLVCVSCQNMTNKDRIITMDADDHDIMLLKGFNSCINKGRRKGGVERIMSKLLLNVPLSILFDVCEHTLYFQQNVICAATHLTLSSIKSILYSLTRLIRDLWEDFISHPIISNLHPSTARDVIFSLQRKAMKRRRHDSTLTKEKSFKSFWSQKFAWKDIPFDILYENLPTFLRQTKSGKQEDWKKGDKNRFMPGSVKENLAMDKMMQKLNTINHTSTVVTYVEHKTDSLSHEEKKRLQRMHKPVSLRHFFATVVVPCVNDGIEYNDQTSKIVQNKSNLLRCQQIEGMTYESTSKESILDINLSSKSGFMCTPKSFPATPSSRAHVLSRESQFVEDIIVLARDQLRLERGLESKNTKTRAMAKALKESNCLAIFNAGHNPGIMLTCGHHCVTKLGKDLYCSARGMVPTMRNCYVYFEMSISISSILNTMLHHVSVCIGLSVLGIPFNTLVGTWGGSVGLCSTGQILMEGKSCIPSIQRTYGSNSTIGCLVFLDDEKTFDTNDGVMVPLHVTYNVNREVIRTLTASEESLESDDLDLLSYVPTLSLTIPSNEEIFPTVTLHSSNTDVTCRFCADDILARSREEIGVPSGKTVHAIDGSVLFDENTDELVVSDNDDDISFDSSEYLIDTHDNLE